MESILTSRVNCGTLQYLYTKLECARGEMTFGRKLYFSCYYFFKLYSKIKNFNVLQEKQALPDLQVRLKIT